MRQSAPTPSLFSGFTADQTKSIIESAELRKFPAGTIIVNGGSPAINLFLITQGTAKYFRVTKRGDEVLLWWLSRDDTFGIGALLAERARYIGTAQSVDDCEMLVWSQDEIRRLAAKYQLLAENALNIVLQYLAAYADRIVGLSTETAEERIARTLLQLSHRVGRVRPTGVEVAIRNEDLSRLADVSPFTASRQLKKWAREGVIQKSRRNIQILSPESLLLD